MAMIHAHVGLRITNQQTRKRKPMADDPTQADLDNRANQLNENNDAYWQSRGEDDRPADWQTRDGD
jgi:hypothetical protein